jgi:hypothetical protein
LKNIELYKPDFVIECNTIEDPAQVYHIMRDNGIKRAYVYGMTWKTTPIWYDFIKVGMSCPNLGERREHQVGERLVRQLSWVPGWSTPPVESDNGWAFWNGIQRHMIATQMVNPDFDKNQISVAVWDVSARMDQFDFVGDDQEFMACTWSEGRLADQYKKINNGKLPPLNHRDPSQSKTYRGPKVSKALFSNFFVEEDI